MMDLKTLPRSIRDELKGKHILDQSAKLAFYFLLSVFPLLLILVSIFGMLLSSKSDFQQTIETYLKTVAPQSASALITSVLKEISSKQNSVRITFGLIFTWWSATKGILAISDGLNLAYDVKETRKWWKRYLTASALTLAILLLNVFTLLILIYGGELAQFISHHLGFGSLGLKVWSVFQWVFLISYVLLTFNLIYRFAPNIRTHSWFTSGTFVGVALWLLVSYGFKFYLGHTHKYTLVYGSIGAFIVLMMWFYLSAAAILLGGIVNAVGKKQIKTH